MKWITVNQRFVNTQRQWCWVYCRTGRKNSIMNLLLRIKRLIQTGTVLNSAKYGMESVKVSRICSEKRYNNSPKYCQSAYFFGDQATITTVCLRNFPSLIISEKNNFLGLCRILLMKAKIYSLTKKYLSCSLVRKKLLIEWRYEVT